MRKIKKVTSVFAVLILTAAFISGCSESNDTTKTTGSNEGTAASNKGKKVNLLIPGSKLEWTGKKVTGQHNGTVDILKGEMFVDNGKLTGGNFIINFASITVLDLSEAEMNAKLTNHLKSDDFFSAEKYPEGKFEMTAVTPLSNGTGNNYTIGGNLTIKGITKPVTFPAKVNVNGDAITASADFKIDRTLWDVKFRSGKFYENLGDKLINDDIELKLNVSAN